MAGLVFEVTGAMGVEPTVRVGELPEDTLAPDVTEDLLAVLRSR